MNSHSNNNNHSNSPSGEYPINLVLKRWEKTTGNFQQHWRKLTHKQEDRELNQCFFFLAVRQADFPLLPPCGPWETIGDRCVSSSLQLSCCGVFHTQTGFIYFLSHISLILRTFTDGSAVCFRINCLMQTIFCLLRSLHHSLPLSPPPSHSVF